MPLDYTRLAVEFSRTLNMPTTRHQPVDAESANLVSCWGSPRLGAGPQTAAHGRAIETMWGCGGMYVWLPRERSPSCPFVRNDTRGAAAAQLL